MKSYLVIFPVRPENSPIVIKRQKIMYNNERTAFQIVLDRNPKREENLFDEGVAQQGQKFPSYSFLHFVHFILVPLLFLKDK